MALFCKYLYHYWESIKARPMFELLDSWIMRASISTPFLASSPHPTHPACCTWNFICCKVNIPQLALLLQDSQWWGKSHWHPYDCQFLRGLNINPVRKIAWNLIITTCECEVQSFPEKFHVSSTSFLAFGFTEDALIVVSKMVPLILHFSRWSQWKLQRQEKLIRQEWLLSPLL